MVMVCGAPLAEEEVGVSGVVMLLAPNSRKGKYLVEAIT
jgi:hypothetical protein